MTGEVSARLAEFARLNLEASMDMNAPAVVRPTRSPERNSHAGRETGGRINEWFAERVMREISASGSRP